MLKGQAGATAGQYLISYVEMATDRYLGFRFPAALATIATARKQLKDVNPANVDIILDPFPPARFSAPLTPHTLLSIMRYVVPVPIGCGVSAESVLSQC